MRRQQGFSLIEVLVAVAIFSVGLLSLAGLQMVSLSGMKSAQLRSVAVQLANDMADRMRANQTGARAGNYVGAGAADIGCAAVHYAHTHAAPVACTPATLAQDDLYDWNQMVQNLLPGGAGVVCVDSTPYDGTPAAPACDGVQIDNVNVYAVKVWWNDKPGATAPVMKLVAVEVQP